MCSSDLDNKRTATGPARATVKSRTVQWAKGKGGESDMGHALHGNKRLKLSDKSGSALIEN